MELLRNFVQSMARKTSWAVYTGQVLNESPIATEGCAGWISSRAHTYSSWEQTPYIGRWLYCCWKIYNLCLEEKISQQKLQEHAANVTGNPSPWSSPVWLFTLAPWLWHCNALTRMAAPFVPNISHVHTTHGQQYTKLLTTSCQGGNSFQPAPLG